MIFITVNQDPNFGKVTAKVEGKIQDLNWSRDSQGNECFSGFLAIEEIQRAQFMIDANQMAMDDRYITDQVNFDRNQEEARDNE